MSDSFATPWTVTHRAPLSTGCARQEYQSGLPFLPLGYLPNSGFEPASAALAGRFLSLFAKLLQSCQTLCDPVDYSPRGSSVPGTLQARILE